HRFVFGVNDVDGWGIFSGVFGYFFCCVWLDFHCFVAYWAFCVVVLLSEGFDVFFCYIDFVASLFMLVDDHLCYSVFSFLFVGFFVTVFAVCVSFVFFVFVEAELCYWFVGFAFWTLFFYVVWVGIVVLHIWFLFIINI